MTNEEYIRKSYGLTRNILNTLEIEVMKTVAEQVEGEETEESKAYVYGVTSMLESIKELFNDSSMEYLIEKVNKAEEYDKMLDDFMR